MKKAIIVTMILILSTMVYGDTVLNYLTKGFADTLYCNIDGTNCVLGNGTGGRGKQGDNNFLYNDTTTMFFNDTKLNYTISNFTTGQFLKLDASNDPLTGTLSMDTQDINGVKELDFSSGVRIGSGTTGGATSSICIGRNCNTQSESMTIGFGATAYGDQSTAVGYRAGAGQQSSAFGSASNASGTNTVASGVSSKAENIGSIAIGNAAEAYFQACVALGQFADCHGSRSLSIGAFSNSSGLQCTSIGYEANCTATYSMAIGRGSQATAFGAIAIGNDVINDQPNTVRIGTNSIFLDYGGSNINASNRTTSGLFCNNGGYCVNVSDVALGAGTTVNNTDIGPNNIFNADNISTERVIFDNSGLDSNPVLTWESHPKTGLFLNFPGYPALTIEGVNRQEWQNGGSVVSGNLNASGQICDANGCIGYNGSGNFVKLTGDTMTGSLVLNEANLTINGSTNELRIGSNNSNYWRFYHGQANNDELNIDHRVNGVTDHTQSVFWNNRFKAQFGIDMGDSGEIRFFNGIGANVMWQDFPDHPELTFMLVDPVPSRFRFTNNNTNELDNVMEGVWNISNVNINGSVRALNFVDANGTTFETGPTNSLIFTDVLWGGIFNLPMIGATSPTGLMAMDGGLYILRDGSSYPQILFANKSNVFETADILYEINQDELQFRNAVSYEFQDDLHVTSGNDICIEGGNCLSDSSNFLQNGTTPNFQNILFNDTLNNRYLETNLTMAYRKPGGLATRRYYADLVLKDPTNGVYPGMSLYSSHTNGFGGAIVSEDIHNIHETIYEFSIQAKTDACTYMEISTGIADGGSFFGQCNSTTPGGAAGKPNFYPLNIAPFEIWAYQSNVYDVNTTIDLFTDTFIGWLGDDDTGNYLKYRTIIDDDLNVSKNFTGNQLYGEMYTFDAVNTINLVTVNVWENVTSLKEGSLNGFSFFNDTSDNSAVLQVVKDGLYKVDYSISYSITAGSDDIESGVAVNGVIQENTVNHRGVSSASIGVVAGTGLIALSANDRVTIQMKDEDSPVRDPIIDHVSFTIMRVGD